MAGNVLFVVAALAVLIPLALYFFAAEPTDLPTVGATALVVLVLVYLGAVFRVNRTELRVTPEGHAMVWYGPLPLLPPARIQKTDLGFVYALREKGRQGDPVWRVDLFTREKRAFPLFVGGAPSEASAVALEKLIRERLSLPAAPFKAMTFEQARKGISPTN